IPATAKARAGRRCGCIASRATGSPNSAPRRSSTPRRRSSRCSRRKDGIAPTPSSRSTAPISGSARPPTSTCSRRRSEPVTLIGLAGILVGLGLLIALAFRGWSVLLLAPVAALIAALFAGEPLLAHWTQTFMGSAAGFLARFFPLFLLGA